MTKQSLYVKKAKELRTLGYVAGYDLRKTLTKSQRDHINRKWKEFKHVIKKPEDFHIQRVSNENARILRKAGYKVPPNKKAVIPLHDYDSAKIENGQLKFFRRGVAEDVLLVGSKDFESKLRELMAKKLARNEQVSIRIGNGPTIGTRLNSMADLVHYVNHGAKFNSPRGQVLPLISVVKITRERGQREKQKGTPTKRRRNR